MFLILPEKIEKWRKSKRNRFRCGQKTQCSPPSPHHQFHVSVGIAAIVFGFLALAVKAPVVLHALFRLSRFAVQVDALASKIIPEALFAVGRLVHATFGRLFVLFSVFMPITANWILPRFGTPLLIVYLIILMYLSIAAGIAAITLYRFLNRERAAMMLLQSKHPRDLNDPLPNERHVWLVYLHFAFMLIGLILILGAAQAFAENSRARGFPYNQGVASTLTGRCYGRDLRDPDRPWLN